MRGIKIISLLICLSVFMGCCCSAQEASNWYIVKHGNEAPGFPANSEEVKMLGGIFIDEKSRENGEKKLYLTFDAGYENGNISKILDVMKKENVKGAFFILSNLINKNPDLVRRIAEEGHLVCNHTYNHKDLTKMSDNEILENLKRLEEKYKSETGREMEKLFRFPEGRYNIHVLNLLNENGYRSVFWSMAYDDWDNSRQMSEENAKRKLLTTTHDGAIILLHPTSQTNAKILEYMIQKWKSQGYSFGSLNDM